MAENSNYRNAMSLFKEGTKLYKQKKYLEAEKKFNEALKIFPDYEDIMYNLALTYMEQKKYDLAFETVNKIKEIDCENIYNELKKINHTKEKKLKENIENNLIQESEKKETFSVIWLEFYTHVLLPVIIITNICYVVYYILYIKYPFHLSNIIHYFNYFNIIIIITCFITLGILTVIGLHKYNRWGYKLNLYVLAIEMFVASFVAFVFFFPSQESFHFFETLFGCFLMWFLPNYLYFSRRKSIFK